MIAVETVCISSMLPKRVATSPPRPQAEELPCCLLCALS